MDCRSVVWSGSNWSSLANAGSHGGSFTSTRGTPPVKGTVVNSITPINFNGSQGLGLSSTVFSSAGRFAFYVVKFGSGRNTIYGRNWDVGADSEVLYGRDSDSGPHWPRWFNAGFNSSYVQTDPGTSLLQSNWVIPSGGGASPQRLNGVAQTMYGANVATPAATRDLSIGDSGTTYGPEGLVGDAFYIAVSDVYPSAGEIEQMEGWASWTFAGDGSLLPVGHPYKSAAPMVGYTGTGYTLVGSDATLTKGLAVSKTISAAAGSYALVGAATPATLLVKRKVAAAVPAAAYAVTGQPATLTYRRKINNTATFGTYGPLAGQPATLTRLANKILAAAALSPPYALVAPATPVPLTYRRKINNTATFGTYGPLAGQTATLAKGAIKKLDAGSGQLTH